MDQLHPHYFNTTSFLTKGSQVEVSSDEDGLNGAWFVATVIHPPPSISISTTKKNNHHTRNNLVYVEYHNLLSEDGSSRRLREYANVSYVRPSPQPDTNAAAPNFQLNDLVDAFYRDGWWTGVITAVVDSSNFLVTFQNPPDQIHFNSSDLRVHRRWDGCRWVQPEIQRTAGLMFTVGKKVEVCFEGQNLHDVWFPATVVENLGNNTFLVEYQQPGISDEATLHKVNVDYLHIRPSPPHLRDKNFVLLEKVDAYYDFGWWSGAITKEVADNRYNVFFKHTKKEREFDCSRVRPHMEWKGGQWFTTSQRGKRGKNDEHKTPTMNSSRKKGRLETEIRSSSVALGEGGKDDTRRQENVEKEDLTLPVVVITTGNGMTVSQEKKLEQLSIPNVVAEGVGLVDKEEGKEGGAESVAPTPTPKRKRGRPPKLQAAAITPDETPVAAVAVDHENEGVGPPEMEGGQRSASSVTKPSLEQAAADNDTSSAVPVPVMEVEVVPNENDINVELQEEEGKKYSSMKGKRGTRRTICSINNSEDSKDKADKDDSDNDNSPTIIRNVFGKSLSESDDQQPPSRWLVQSPTVDGGTEGTVPSKRKSSSCFGDKKQQLPFKIRTPTLWKTMESTEAFSKLPQRPHFRPLQGMKESAREGLAICHMVTFANVVDKTLALRFEDPRSAIEECLETLAELETHGFEVEVVRERLTRLLLIKDNQEELQQRSKGMTQKLEEARMEGSRMDAQLAEMEREIVELEETRRQLLSAKDKHKAQMEAAGDSIHQQLVQVGLEFDGLAAAPFL